MGRRSRKKLLRNNQLRPEKMPHQRAEARLPNSSPSRQKKTRMSRYAWEAPMICRRQYHKLPVAAMTLLL